jgi:hypothetical protein
MDPVLEPKGDVIVKFPTEKVDAEKPGSVNGSIPESTLQCKITLDVALTYHNIWEGTIHLSLTSLTNIVSIFKRFVHHLAYSSFPQLINALFLKGLFITLLIVILHN